MIFENLRPAREEFLCASRCVVSVTEIAVRGSSHLRKIRKGIKPYMRTGNFGQIGLFTSELLAFSIFSIVSHISHRVQWEKNTKIKTKDEY